MRADGRDSNHNHKIFTLWRKNNFPRSSGWLSRPESSRLTPSKALERVFSFGSGVRPQMCNRKRYGI